MLSEARHIYRETRKKHDLLFNLYVMRPIAALVVALVAKTPVIDHVGLARHGWAVIRIRRGSDAVQEGVLKTAQKTVAFGACQAVSAHNTG